MFELSWQEFSRRPQIARLPMHEQIRQFQWEQQRYQLMLEYVSSAASAAGSSGAGGGNSTVAIETIGVNGYVEDGYIGEYFEI